MSIRQSVKNPISIDLPSLWANAISKTVNTKRGSIGHISKIAAGDVG